MLVKMPNTPKYFQKARLVMVSRMKGVLWLLLRPPKRPMLHSIHSSGMPMSRKQMRYGMMKAPPPLFTACTGKRRKLPSPTALPAMARISPTLVPHDSC